MLPQPAMSTRSSRSARCSAGEIAGWLRRVSSRSDGLGRRGSPGARRRLRRAGSRGRRRRAGRARSARARGAAEHGEQALVHRRDLGVPARRAPTGAGGPGCDSPSSIGALCSASARPASVIFSASRSKHAAAAQERLVLERGGVQQADRRRAAQRRRLGVLRELRRHAERFAARPSTRGCSATRRAAPRAPGAEQLQVEAVAQPGGGPRAEAHELVQLALGRRVRELHAPRRSAGPRPPRRSPRSASDRSSKPSPRAVARSPSSTLPGTGSAPVRRAVGRAVADAASRAGPRRRRRPAPSVTSAATPGRAPAHLGSKPNAGARAQVGDCSAAGEIALAGVGIQLAQHVARLVSQHPELAPSTSMRQPWALCGDGARAAKYSRRSAISGVSAGDSPGPVPVLQGETPPRCRLRLHQPDYSSAPPAWGSYPASLARNERGSSCLPACRGRVTEVCRVPHPGPGGAWLPAAG